MGKSKRPGYFDKKAFLTCLRDILSALPTESEKQEIQANFAVLTEFLTTLKTKIDMLPSTEDMNGVSRVIQNLEELFVKAETNPILAGIVGMSCPSPARERKPATTEEEIAKAKAELATLESLPIDTMRVRLQDRNYSMSELYAIAAELGIRSTKRLNRETLAHQITMKIANYRGYQRLGGQVEERNV